jgi:hypothetical protein
MAGCRNAVAVMAFWSPGKLRKNFDFYCLGCFPQAIVRSAEARKDGHIQLSMQRHGITADNQVSNFLGVEDGQEFFEVVEHPMWVPSACKLQG